MKLRTITYDTATHKLVPLEPTEAMITAKPKPAGIEGQCVQTQKRNADIRKYQAMVAAAPEYQEPEIDLESRDFYEVMQAYRHDQGTGNDSFEAVKQWLRNPVYLYQDIGKDE